MPRRRNYKTEESGRIQGLREHWVKTIKNSVTIVEAQLSYQERESPQTEHYRPASETRRSPGAISTGVPEQDHHAGELDQEAQEEGREGQEVIS